MCSCSVFLASFHKVLWATEGIREIGGRSTAPWTKKVLRLRVRVSSPAAGPSCFSLAALVQPPGSTSDAGSPSVSSRRGISPLSRMACPHYHPGLSGDLALSGFINSNRDAETPVYRCCKTITLCATEQPCYPSPICCSGSIHFLLSPSQESRFCYCVHATTHIGSSMFRS